MRLRAGRQPARVFVFAGLLAGALRAYLAMNFSVSSRASLSGRWFIGGFMRYELGPLKWPDRPLLRASLQQRTTSVTIPAEFVESQTSNLISSFSGTLPNASPSSRMCAHLR